MEEVVLGEMLDKGLKMLTGAPTAGEVWRLMLGEARRIVLKFNQVGEAVLQTSTPLARALVGSLAEAGYDRRWLTLVEAPRGVSEQLETRLPEVGWGAAIPVGDGREEVARYLHEADAVINVAFLKTHRIAGMSGALKNLSHALIRHPARYHDHACSPYVGQVVGDKEVSARLRLNVVNVLRAVIRNGPEAAQDDVIGHCGLLLGFDPVAVDTVGHELLLARRKMAGISDTLRVPYLEAAAQWGVGRRAAREIERIPVGSGS